MNLKNLRQKSHVPPELFFLLICALRIPSTTGLIQNQKILFLHLTSSYSHQVQTLPIAEELSRLGNEVTYINSFSPKDLITSSNISELVVPSLIAYHEGLDRTSFGKGEFAHGASSDFGEFSSSPSTGGEFGTTGGEFSSGGEFGPAGTSGEFGTGPVVSGSQFGAFLNRLEKERWQLHTFMFDIAYGHCKALLTSLKFHEWLESNPKFDLVIIDNWFPECGLAIAHQLQAKPIIFNTVASVPSEYDSMGYLPQGSAIPEFEAFPVPLQMGFIGRAWNTFLSLVWRYKHYSYAKKIDKLVKKTMTGTIIPDVDALMRNVSLVFTTSNYVSGYGKVLPSNFVDVSGIHVKEDVRPLPEEVESFINSNSTSDGFVYISFGTVIKAPNLPKCVRNAFMDMIRSFPNVKFLWSWDGDLDDADVGDLPDNLMLATWFPQNDVLGHPKIKGFITQGGRPSTTEGLYHGVPMVVIPVFGDQRYNAERLQEFGVATMLEITALKKAEFRAAVEKLSSFDMTKKAKKAKSIFRDRPMSPLETAMWWIDYVLRHEDTTHLRAEGNDQFWFVRRQVDVWAFLILLIVFVSLVVLVLLRKMIKIGISFVKRLGLDRIANRKAKLA